LKQDFETISSMPPQNKHRYHLTIVAVPILVLLLISTMVTLFLRHLPQGSMTISQRQPSQISSPLPTPWDDIHLISPTTAWVSTSVHLPGEGDVAGPLLRTSDGGDTWQDVTPPQQGFEGGTEVYPLDEKTAWVLMSPEAPKRSGTTTLYHTMDGGISWQPLTTPNVFINTLSFIDAHHGWIVGYDTSRRQTQIFATTNSGQSWQTLFNKQPPVVSTSSQGSTQIQFVDAQTGWLTVLSPAGARQLYVSQNGGLSWRLLSLPGQIHPSLTSFFVNFFNKRNGYLVVSHTSTQKKLTELTMYPTRDGGQTWQSSQTITLSRRDSLFRFLNDYQTIDLSPTALLLSTYSTNHWRATTVPAPTGGHFLFTSFVSSTVGLALVDYTLHTFPNSFDSSSDRLKLLKTTNGGKTWMTLPLSFPAQKVTPYTMAYVTHPGWTFFTAHQGAGSASFSPKDQSAPDHLNPAHLPNLKTSTWLVRFLSEGASGASLALNGKRFSAPACNHHPISTLVSFPSPQEVETLDVSTTSNSSWLVVFEACTNAHLCKRDNH
jgi:photosystem II stability/assembly factor-like uncharacterized protein